MDRQCPPLTPETQRRVEALFKGENRSIVMQQLIERCGSSLPLTTRMDESGFERLRFAVLKLSGGNMKEFARAVEPANWDWRDLLMAAGFGEDVSAHERWFPVSLD